MALELGGLTSTVASLKSLGKTVVEMQDNINKLQNNVNTVKKIRDDIANYQGVYNKVTGGESGKEKLSPEMQKGLQKILPGGQQTK